MTYHTNHTNSWTKRSACSNWPIQDSRTRKVTQTQAVALGLGSLFNHSTHDQNVGWSRDLGAQCIVYRALHDIRAGEELCISYGRLWFADTDPITGEDGKGNELNDDDNLLGILESDS